MSASLLLSALHGHDTLPLSGCAALGHLVTLLGQRLGADVQHLLAFVTQAWPEVARLSDVSLVALCRLLETVSGDLE